MEEELLNANFLETNIGNEAGSNLRIDACSTVLFALGLTTNGRA